MSYIITALRPQFEPLSINLKNEILSRNVHLEPLQDLIAVLEQITAESPAAPKRGGFFVRYPNCDKLNAHACPSL